MATGLSNVANLSRVVVAFRTNDVLEKPKIADFFTCLVHHFSPNEKSTTLNCKIEDDVLLLYPANQENEAINEFKPKADKVNGTELESVTLYHSPECPLWRIQDSKTPLRVIQNKGIYVGVAVLVESSDSRILMTQRSDHMRSFPRAWVPPGGHLDVGETLMHGALRELEEEAGLVLNSSNSNTHLFCLWESAFPPLIALGEPRNHHVVLYFHAKTLETSEQLQAKIKLDPKEVKACTWLTRDNVQSICSGQKDGIENIQQFVVGKDGEIQSAELNIHRMFHTELWRDGEIYTGSQLALTRWIEHMEESSNIQIPSKI